MRLKKIIAATAVALSALGLASCASPVVNDANVVSQNIATAAENFQVNRRILFINNMTSESLQTIEGWCNFELIPVIEGVAKLEVICKAGKDLYLKHNLIVNNVTTASVEQLDPAGVSADHYKVVIKPSVLVPDIDIK